MSSNLEDVSFEKLETDIMSVLYTNIDKLQYTRKL